MSAAASTSSSLKAFRLVISELRKVDKNFTKDSQQFKYVVGQMRDHQLTQRIFSKSPKEAEHVAHLYASYLSSTRRLTELEAKYKSHEKTVEESANLVGLALPKTFLGT